MILFRRVLAWYLAAVMLLSCLPAGAVRAYASETGETEVIEELAVSQDYPESEELYDGYLEGLFYGKNDVSFLGELARNELNAQGQYLYDFLKPSIQQVAAGTLESTAFQITNEQILAWGGAGTYAVKNGNAALKLFMSEFQLEQVVDALLHDCPYELYWFDKVSGVKIGGGARATDAGYMLTYVSFRFQVVADWQGSGYAVTTPTVNTDIISTAKAAAANAAKVVEQYSGASDYRKLSGYSKEICDRVSYDYSADAGNYAADNDPWQLIYVFDGNTSTNVVCEGYAKAFQYLCEISDFSGNVDCYSVTGDLVGIGGHMWNIVTIDGSNYLVDVTNSDSGTSGNDGSLFLAGGSGSIAGGYTFGSTGFAYDSDSLTLWGTGDSSILKLAGEYYDPCPNGHTEQILAAVASTCTTDGLTEGAMCTVCAAVIRAQEIVSAPGHSYTSVVTAPTCAEQGYTTYTCSCGDSYVGDYTDPTGEHIYSDDSDAVCESCNTSAALKNFAYTLDETTGTITLTDYIGSETTVEVKGSYTANGVEYNTVLDSSCVFTGDTAITSAVLVGDIAFVNNSMSNLFSGCTALKTVDLSGLNSTGVTDMSYLFTDCSSLTSVDVTDLETSAVTTMYGMFSKCKKLSAITGYENWDTGSLQVMRHMFNYVQSMETIDLSKWDLSQVINSGWCFQYCFAKKILLPDNLKTISAGFLNHAQKVEGSSFTIPAGVEKIGYAHTIYDFATDDFVEFIVAEGNENYVAIDGILYSADGTEMLAVPRNKTFENNTYEIPEGVTFLGELSFSRNYNIETVVLPNSFVIEYVPLYDPDYIIVDDTGNLNTGTNLSIAIYCYTGITQYAVKDDNPNYASQNGIIYSKDMTQVVAVPARYARKMEIPEGVTTWNREAMWADYDNNATVDNLMKSCPGVSIPASLTVIAEDQLTKLNRLNAAFDTFVIEVAEENPAYCLDENGNLVEHSLGDGVVNAPSCTEKGYTTVTCSICGNSYTTEETAATGHTEEIIPAVDATCTETGLTEGKRCTECGEVIAEQEVAPAIGHSFTSYISNGDATAVLDGTKTAKCESCDATKTLLDSGSALGTEQSLDPLYTELKARPGQLIPDSFEIAENEIYGYIAGYQLKKGHSLSISDTDYVFSVRKLADENYSTMLKQATTASFTATEDMTVAMLIRKPDKSALTAEELANVVIYDSQYGMIGVEGFAHRFTVEAETIDGGTATTRAAIFLPDSYTGSGAPTRLVVMTNGYHAHLTNSVWNANAADDVAVMKHYMDADYAVLVVDNTAQRTTATPDLGCPQLVSSYFKAYDYVQAYLNVEERFSIHSRSMGTFAAMRIMRERPELVKCAIMCGPITSLQSRFSVEPAFIADRFGFDDSTGATYEADKVVGYDPYTDVDGIEYDLPPTFWMMATSDVNTALLDTIEKIEAHGNEVSKATYTDTDHSGVCRLNTETCRTDALTFLNAHQESDAKHRYCAWTVTKAATCTEGGSMKRVCADCGDIQTMTLEAIGYHTYDGVSLCPVCGCEVAPIESQIIVEKGQFSDTTGEWQDSDIYGCVIAYKLKKGHTLSISDENYVFSVRVLENGSYSTMLKAADTSTFTAEEDMTVAIRVRKPDKSAVSAEELANVTIVDTVYVEKEYETLEDKTLSILGASISTYAGTSNGVAADTSNSTIRSNVAYYPNSTIPEVTLKDTWWMQVCEDLGLRLLVNNSWSGSSLLHERSGTVGAYVDRCVQLHDDTGDNAGEEPDIIAIQMGTNDFQYYKDTLGTADIDYAALITDNGDGSFSYAEPTTSLEAAAIVLHKISVRYPHAEIYYLNISQRVDGTDDLIQSFNADLKTVAEHFDASIVDIYGSAITMEDFGTYIGDGRVHPNNFGMDAYTEAFKAAFLANSAYSQESHMVSFDLTDVSADYGTDKAVVSGDAFSVNLTADAGKELSVTVTMGGEDITDSAYEDGTVVIDAVTADVVITAKGVAHELQSYHWEFDGTDLVCVSGENALTNNAGTTTNGVFNKTRYALETAVQLLHDEPWIVEWKCQGTFLNTNGSSGARVFTTTDVNADYNARYIFKSNTNGIIAMGEKTTTGSHNYGIALADYDIDWTQLHTYRLENRIAADGSNIIWLYVDGEEIGPMVNYYVGTTDKNTTSDWLSGKDFVFPYMGTDTHGFTNCSIDYIQVWEAGKTSKEPSDYSGKTLSILGDSISTYTGVSNNTSYNSTIGSNAVYYSAGTLGVYQADTWWQQVIDALDMELLVNNSWSGSCILNTRSGTVGAYIDRCVQLHNNAGQEPDVIAVFLGTNDFSYYQDTLGTADAIDYAALITENSDGTFSYAKPATSCEAYAIMLHKMQQRYPDADIYCMTLTSRRDPDKEDSYADVGQPTAFNAELTEIIEHFDCTVVDLENCGIDKEAEVFDTYMGDGRVHPNAQGMDLIAQALVSTMLGEEATVYDVSYDLTNVTGEGAHAALEGAAYGLTLTAEDGFKYLQVTVTMGGVDITESCYADGMITIPAVTGDVVITAIASGRDPLNFRWEFDGTNLVNVRTDGNAENALTRKSGTTTDSVLSNTYYQMDRSVILNHDRPWVVQWKCAGDWSGMLLSSAASAGTDGNGFLFRTTGSTDFVGFGERRDGSYHNYGIALADCGIDSTSEHSYRLENRIAEDGSNMVYLIVDGTELGTMNNYYIGGTNDQGKTVDWVNGKDFSFSYIGAASHALNDLEIKYVQVWEAGENTEPLSLRYDDHYDVSNKTVEIVNVGVPTSYQVGYGVAEGTLDTAVVTIEGDSLVATGIGTATVRINGQLYEVTVTAAPISLLLLAGQSNMQGSEGNADQSIVCPDGMVYATYGDRYTMTVDNATNFAPSALTGDESALNVSGTTTNLEDWPVYLLNEAGAGKAGPDSGFAYEWVKQTGEKVWVVNAAHGGSSITTWQDGGANYEEAILLFSACQETLRKEIAAGHFTLSHMGYFWCQGCTDYSRTAEWYVEKYLAMHENFKTELAFDHDGDSSTENVVFEFGGIIPVRAGHEYYTSYRQGVYTGTTTAKYHESFKDLRFTGPRVAQYWMGNNPELEDIWIVCNIGENWVWMPDGTNGVSDYFQAHYENGTVDYTPQVAQSESWYTPTTPAAVHDSIHYNQIGYNEVGRESVRNALIMLGEIEAPEAETTVEFLTWDGYTPAGEIAASTSGASGTLVVPVVYPVWKSKEVTYQVSEGLNYEYYDLLADTTQTTGTLTADGVDSEAVNIVKADPYSHFTDHLSQLPENVCCGLNLWNALEHDKYYYTNGSSWGIHSSGTVYSVTIPVSAGDKIYASSFGAAGTNGHSSTNGIRITFFDEYGVVKTLAPSETYPEFTANGGYLTAPEGTVAVNVPMWTNSEQWELYILNREHDEGSDICSICGKDSHTHTFSDWKTVTAPSIDGPGTEQRTCTGCGESEMREVEGVWQTMELSEHMSTMPESYCSNTNLWPLLEHDKYYFNGSTSWTVHSSGAVYSVTIPVNPGDQIYATSFDAAGTNGGSKNGIRVTFFDAYGIAKTLAPAETYAELTASGGYLITPEGTVAVNIPMWNDSDENELYILNREHSYESTVTAPTCTEQGCTTHTCSVCGDSYVDSYVDALGHSYGEWMVTTSPTCTATGEERRDCADCDSFETRSVAATGHSYQATVTDPTCTEQGYTTYTCACGDTYIDDYVAAKGHTEVIDAAVAASCTASGLTQGKHCAVCNEVLIEQAEVPANGHSYESVITAPTCTEQGYTTYTCAACGDSYVDSYVSAKGHTAVIDKAVEATCTTAGKTEGSHCSVCGTVLKAQTTIAAKGHTAVTDKAVAATCTTAGKTEGSHCSVCNAVIKAQTTVAAKGHTAVTDAAVAATCTTAGKTEGSHCSVCGTVIKAQATIAAKGHTAVTDKAEEATCTTAGKTEGSHCSVCNAVIKAQTTVAAKGHAEVINEAVDATCTEAGLTEGKHCSVCDTVLVEQESIPALGHSYDSVVTEPTCMDAGFTTHTCAVCGDSYVDSEVEATGEHTYLDEKDTDCELCGHVREIKIETTPMYRLYNPNSGEHFYTGSEEERDILITAGWQYEGVAWNAPVKEGEPVHRVYNPNSGDHHYTMSQDEVDMLVALGWQYENVAWNSASPENLPLYRLYNPNADCGSHHYTGSEEERDNLVSVGWIYEGIGWYGMLR